MSDVTRILDAIDQGDPHAAGQLLPLVYDELRKLAAAKLAHETPGHTLQPTALVHEAYLRLVSPSGGRQPPEQNPQGADAPRSEQPEFANRGHFFAAAAEAMRRILVDRARRKATHKHGGHTRRLDLDHVAPAADERYQELLDLDEALGELERHDAPAARLVKLRYFAGLSHQEAADALGISRRAADRVWALARAWLYQRLAAE